MRKKLLILLIITMLTFSIGVTAYANEIVNTDEASVVYFVSPDGDDSFDGTFEKPFKTITAARDKIRELKKSKGLPEGGITVYLRGGNYPVTEEILFTKEDSGSENSPIVYKAYPNETPVINGGIQVPGKNFRKVTDESVLEKLPTAKARKNVLCVNLKDYGMDTFKEWKDFRARNTRPGHLVFIGEKYMDLARWPNKRENRVQEVTYCGEVLEKGTKSGGLGPKWVYTDGRPDRWKDTKYAMVSGYFPEGYSIEYSAISIDKENKTVQMQKNVEYGPKLNSRYFYMNILEELDAPNEYYLDIDTGMLYIYPDVSIRNETVGITSYGDNADEQLIHFDGASYITLSGLTVTLSNASGIFAQASDNIVINNCDVTNIGITGIAFGSKHHYQNPLGARGVWMTYTHPSIQSWGVTTSTKEEWEKYNVTNSVIMNSRILNCGLTNVSVYSGDRYDLIPGNNLVTNCEIRESGICSGQLGRLVSLGGVGNTLSHSTLSGSDGKAVDFNGNDLIFEYNDVSDALRVSNDMGVFYVTGWDVELCVGTEIRYNYIHDVHNVLDGGGDAWGNGYNGVAIRPAIYNDNSNPFLEIHHNIFENVPIGSYGYGNFENNYNYNLFIDVDYPFIQSYNNGPLSAWKTKGNPFNALGFREFEILEGNKAWEEKYPIVDVVRQKLLTMGDDMKYMNADLKGNVAVFNNNKEKMRKDGEEVEFSYGHDYRYVRRERNISLDTDPGFVDLEGGDYRWKEDAAIFETHPEMKDVDISKMGVGTNETANKLKNSVTLTVGNPDAVVFGKVSLIDSQNPFVTPVISDSRTLVPVRFISEAFGCEVDWNDDDKTVTVKKDENIVTLTIGQNSIIVNGETKSLDVPATIIYSRTMIPLRALTEALGKEVFWDERGLIVISDEKDFLDSKKDEEIINNLVKYASAY